MAKLKLRINIDSALLGIFTFYFIDGFFRRLAQGQFGTAVAGYFLIGLLIWTATSLMNGKVNTPKLVIAWLPGVWFQNTHDWIYHGPEEKIEIKEWVELNVPEHKKESKRTRKPRQKKS